MRRWMYWLPGAALFTAPVALVQAPAAAPSRSFTATLYNLAHDGEKPSMQERLTVRGDVLRMQRDKDPVATLFDYGQGKWWMLLPADKVALEGDITPKPDSILGFLLTDASGNPCPKDPAYTCVREGGEETISGRPVVMWRILHPDKAQQGRKRLTHLIWVDPKLGAPVRIALEDGNILELRDIKEGPVDEALVQVPADFTRVDEKNVRHTDEPEPAPKPKKKGTVQPKKP
ncbi:hypothetical protein NR798_21370 [Archangium gephyra]|uniref:hypothetical protein n=1 Tax=Archangium gephyra TaxID=48 RepID=UPI0035D4A1A8